MKITKILWTLPFFSFMLGYYLLDRLYTVEKIDTPNLVGMQLTEAVKISSSKNLNLRIINEQIDLDLPANTVLSQTPNNRQIRPNQAIFVVISKKPLAKIAPNLSNCPPAELTTRLNQAQIKNKSYTLPSAIPKDWCICQSPPPGQIAPDGRMLTYLSQGINPLVIMPKLVNLPLEDVKSFLDMQNLKYSVTSLNQNKLDFANNALVVAQKPNFGTIVNLDKLTQIELAVD